MANHDLGALLCALPLLASPAAAQLTFSDATLSSGLIHTHAPLFDQPGMTMAGGASPGDFDRDGWVDLFVPSDGTQPDRLFINQRDGSFVDQAAAWQLTDLYRGMGCSSADYDSDGWLDIYVTSMGDAQTSPKNGMHRLYHNELGESFSEVAVAAGVNSTQSSNLPDGYGVTWGDYDLDSDLDLWVAGWHKTPFSGAEAIGTRLFRNEGDGSFTDVTVSSEVYTETIRSFGAIFVDVDGDRYPELLVAADFGTSRYFKNLGDGTFTRELWYLPGGDKVHNGMGTTLADFDRNGTPDWFITAIWPSWGFHGPDGNRLYMSDGGGSHHFTTLSPALGVDDGGWGWGAAANDFDHNGRTDIVHTNGWHNPDPVTGYDFTADPTRLFMQSDNDSGVFTDSAASAGITHTGQGRGLVTWDPDRDGDMDVLIVTNLGDLQYFRNDLSGPLTNWLTVRLDTSGNPALPPDGLGSKVQVFAPQGVVQTAWLTGGANYLSHSEHLVHFGVKGLSTSDRLEVSWADGFKSVLTDVTSNQEIVVSAQLPYSHTALIGGSNTEFEVAGIEDGEAAVLLFSLDTELGNGACFPGLGNLCIDLVSPALLGTAVADESGTASLSLPIPVGLGGLSIASQAIVPRGPAWTHSLKTNALVSTLQ